jgi:hypothetical protein
MRLTLRTMLAYVDDILEAADAQDVGKKISESEFATSLMHRMRDVTRRLRLGAPKLHGRGMGNDANTVAEYLDNTLLSERVADFEKVCLESDVHLAEVASCHQILALVLGEPAEIESTSRQRLYALPQQAEAATRSPPPAKASKPSRDSAGRSARRKKKRRKVEVPDYLRQPVAPEPQPRRWGALLIAAVLLLLAGVGLATYGPDFYRRLQVAQRDQAGESTVAANDRKAATQQTTATDVAGSARDSTTPAKPDTESASKPSGKEPIEEPADDASTDAAPPSPVEEPTDNDTRTPATAEPVEQPATADRRKPAEVNPADDSNMPDEAADNGGTPKPRPDRLASVPRDKTTAKPAKEEPAREAPTGEGIGRLVSEHDVLLRTVEDNWQRVPGRGTVYAGERLIALPTYRPSVAMSNGVTLELLGGAVVSLDAPADDGGAQIRLWSGRILLLTVAKPETKIHLQAGDYRGTIEFGRDESALAVEVRHLLPEGADPEQEPAPTAVDLYLSSGEATWVAGRGRSEKLSGRSHRSLGEGKSAKPAAEELPAWLEANQLNPNERRASADLDSFLRPDKPAGPALAELATHRRIENSLLAIQCLAMIDDFAPIVPLLNDPKYRGTMWTAQIESLRAALARSPKTAAEVRKAFETARGREQGDQLYRMLWGYTSQQLEDGAAAQLIEWLAAPGDDQLDFRVLSFWNLHHITGLGLYYQPADPEKQRRQSIQRWQQKLQSGLLVPKAT